MNITLQGRIDHTEFYNNAHTVILAVAAADQYSLPSTYKLRSPNAMGAVGDELTVHTAVRGFVKRKPYTDKQTNQPKVYWEDNVFFDVDSFEPLVRKPVSKVS